MGYLSGVTCLWAFSFSLIGVYLAGQVDAWFSVVVRVALATLVFIPFLRLKGVSTSLIFKLIGIGAIQLGLMYGFYYQSFLYLTVPEVLLFTVFTPIYVALTHDILKRQFSPWYLVTAVIAVLGAVILKYASPSEHFLFGFLVVQGANLCFALGQVLYKVVIEDADVELKQHTVFGLFFIGALMVALPAFFMLGDMEKLPTNSTQWGILFYLGTIASGMGYFLWNKGATKVNAGALAAMNNALVPAGIIVNVLIWNREADLVMLGIGSAVIVLSVWFNQKWVLKRQHNHGQAVEEQVS
ncbi:EamA family transporter [Veronia nyctiphanis]|uniref:EamA family transporter n=1 Tax=Veronia nyctiphanis TaxID=1278244 RepID=A0A4Q0YUJ9_9GAMM|nr:DMT family transporter [Veronia nyctiphanis]RXJ74966.1 EamA family transporter [Veronia nyctiphanis]